MKESSGTLLYRFTPLGAQLLLVHPSGNYNRRAPWSIPKGLCDEGETLEAAARRETLEETGIAVGGELISLGFIDYTKSRKRIYCFTGEVDTEPRCASWEIDKAEFLSLDDARRLIHPEQRPFIERWAGLRLTH